MVYVPHRAQNVGLRTISRRSRSSAEGAAFPCGEATLHPAGGNTIGREVRTMTTRNATPRTRNVRSGPWAEMRAFMIGATTRAEAPNPARVSPTARPRRSGNHLPATAIGQPYATPTPAPAITP